MKKTLKEVLLAMLITTSIVFSLFAIHAFFHGAQARADSSYDPGCERIRWGFLGSQYRTICDGPIRPDGSWERAREIWTPAGYVPRNTYCSRYGGCSSYGGYHRAQSTQAFEKYIVFPHNVLHDEPGHLPQGHRAIR